jgi:hypothetical protein
MPKQSLTTLKSQLRRLGFSNTINQVEEYAKAGNENFETFMFINSGNDQLMYTLN